MGHRYCGWSRREFMCWRVMFIYKCEGGKGRSFVILAQFVVVSAKMVQSNLSAIIYYSCQKKGAKE